jgi:glycine oxidase
MEKKECIVVGGGIIGMTTARELAMQGLSVSLFDSGNLAQEASWAAGGILSSMRPWSENPESADLSSQGKLCYENFAAELKEQTNIDPEYYRSGLLMINQLDIGHSREWANKNSIVYSDSYHGCPSSMHIPDNALFLPDIAQVRVPRLLKALRASLLNCNVTINENSAVTGLDINEGRCKSVQVGTEHYYADTFIITAGAWSKQLLGENCDHITINPVLGQMLCVKFPEQILDTMVLDGGHYFIPRRDGHVLIGSTMEYVGFEKGTTETARNELMDWASALWPDIKKAELVKHWSGLRPATGNSKPYLEQLPGHENIFINAGHFRKGILQAPVCARMTADLVTCCLGL